MAELIELGAVLGDCFEGGRGPSHDQIGSAFARTGLENGDPAPGGNLRGGGALGKTKRVRAVFTFANDTAPARGLELAQQLVALVRADGMFIPAAPDFIGGQLVERLQGAFRRLGFALDADGVLRPLVIDNLTGTALTAALRSYVDRINLNPDDAALQVGTGKDLDEAVARHVLEQKAGGYAAKGPQSNFPYTLTQAFVMLQMSVPPAPRSVSDPREGVEQALFELAAAVNRLRNEVGTGHGRPSPSQRTRALSPAEARLVARSTALVAGALLDKL